MRAPRLLTAVGTGVLLAIAGAAASQSDPVTMVVTQYRAVNDFPVLRFSGAVASGRAGEIVDLVGRDCGGRGFHVLRGTQTRSGGGWQIENPDLTITPYQWARIESGTTLRARWNDQLSDPYVWRTAAPLFAIPVVGRRAWRVFVSPPQPGLVSMKGKLVVLERTTGGRWIRYQRARLARKPSLTYGALNHEVVFSVPKRGLTLRALLPAVSAAPCYLRTVTEPWRS